LESKIQISAKAADLESTKTSRATEPLAVNPAAADRLIRLRRCRAHPRTTTVRRTKISHNTALAENSKAASQLADTPIINASLVESSDR